MIRLRSSYINVLIVMVIVAGYAYLLFFKSIDNYQSTCLFKGVSGIPCPGCGMGRSTWSLLRGNVMASLYYHPLGMVFNGFLLIALFWSLRDVFYGETSLWKALKRPWPKNYVVILLVMIAVVWGRSIVVGI